ncbi:MAG: hypothetical protein ABJN61_11680 [Flavobacteriaceae bacterium]|uniref:hypothetical protein n=1 Tax=Nonlabens ulvanivorans TaxID=906888 RepID=UPI0032970877
MEGTKEINYRGILKFVIPDNWIEEYDDTHGGSFYEDSELSGTFRVKLLSLTAPLEKGNLSVLDFLNDINAINSEAVLLPNSNGFKKFKENTTESGHEINIFYWTIAQKLNKNKFRLANFSYTILTSQLHKRTTIEAIDFLSNQIVNAEFTKD